MAQARWRRLHWPPVRVAEPLWPPPGTAAIIPCDSPAEAVRLHREMVAGERVSMRRVPYYIQQLRGKTLMCWCREDEPCHGDILLRLANGPPMCFPAEPPARRIEDQRQEAMAL